MNSPISEITEVTIFIPVKMGPFFWKGRRKALIFFIPYNSSSSTINTFEKVIPVNRWNNR